MNPSSESDAQSFMITSDIHPQEWERMWCQLALMPENAGSRTCEYIGHEWQYMGSQWGADDCLWVHCFRHRCHPTTRQCEYRYVPSHLSKLEVNQLVNR